MPVIILKYFFCFIAIFLALLLTLRVLFDNIFKNNNKLSPVVALIGGLFLLYTLIGLILSLVYPNILNKFIMFLFSLSPFIIGKLVSYKRLRLYSIIQVLCVIFSIGFVLIF